MEYFNWNTNFEDIGVTKLMKSSIKSAIAESIGGGQADQLDDWSKSLSSTIRQVNSKAMFKHVEDKGIKLGQLQTANGDWDIEDAKDDKGKEVGENLADALIDEKTPAEDGDIRGMEEGLDEDLRAFGEAGDDEIAGAGDDDKGGDDRLAALGDMV